MKACLFIFTIFFGSEVFALDTEIRGFIALDVFRISKEETRSQEVETGIGVLDLKIYGQQDNVGGKIKLDLDDSKLDQPYNLFEEAIVNYRWNNWKISAGKGKVPYHRLHWGVIQNTYIDGGSTFYTNHGWRDVDQKIVTTITYGGYKTGFRNDFSYWGESKTPSTNKDGTLRYDNNGLIEYRNAKTFSTNDMRGLANKFEFYFGSGWDASIGTIYFQNDFNPHENYGIDIGTRYRKGGVEFWTELSHGFSSTNPGENRGYNSKNETLFQIGAEKVLTDFINIVTNIEYASVNEQRHSDKTNGSEPRDNDGKKYEYDTGKVEAGVKFKLAKRAQLTVGALFEKQLKTVENVESYDHGAYEAAAKLSFWF